MELTRCVANVLYQAALLLTPPQARHTAQESAPIQVDTSLFAPVEAYVREALRIDGVAKAGSLLQREGILKAMFAVPGQPMHDALFNLMTETLDRYNEVRKDPSLLNSEVDFLSRQLEARTDRDLRPYATKLRERYAQPQ